MESKQNLSDLKQHFADHRQDMLELVIRLANENSGSMHIKGLQRVANILQEEFRALDCQQTLMPVAPLKTINDQGKEEEYELGPVLRCWARPQAPMQVLLIGHMDTVFPKDSNFQKTRMIDANTLSGPGVTDMKGGLAVMLWSLKAFEKMPEAQGLGWEVLITSDEEIGSPGSQEIIVSCAKKHTVGLVFEPSIDMEGTLAGERKGSGRFTLIMKGKTSHAGRNFKDGRNAICKMAAVIDEINQLNGLREGVTFNVGYVHGGTAINVVPDLCIVKLNVRVPNNVDMDWVQNSLQEIEQDVNDQGDYKLNVIGGFSRKPKQLDPETERLYKLVQQVGQEQGEQITWRDTGGVSDGNNLSEIGLPNVDTLGVIGKNIHSDKETLYIPSLSSRAELLTNILKNLSKNGFR